MLPSRVMVTSGPRLLLRVMSRSVVLLQPGFVLMSIAPVATKGHVDVLEQCWYPRAMLPLGLY